MLNSMRTGLLALSLAALPAAAQMMPQESNEMVSQPGKGTKTETIRASGVVTVIDKATRTLTIKGPTGRTFDIVAGSEVSNFDQIKVSDIINVEYTKSVELELKKPGESNAPIETSYTSSAEPGAKPAGEMGRSATVLANVIDVDPARKTITIQIPEGKVILLNVKNPDQFKVVKEGDQVEVTYSAAKAVSIEPATEK